jgi:two-component system, LytTR family, sensor kinase
VSTTPFSQNKFLWVFIAWWLIWAGIQAWVLYGIGYPVKVALIDSLLSNVLLASACIVVSNSFQYYLPGREQYLHILIISLVFSGTWVLIIKYLLPVLIPQEESDYEIFLSKSLYVRFGVAFLLIACMSVVSVLWYTFEEQKASARRKADAEQLTKEAELYKLRQQLQPHFLFNSLNSINALIGARPEEARKMVQQLSEFLRGTLKREEQQWIFLQEELQYLQLYLDIEKVRFGNRLSTAFETAADALQMKIPAMLLQPLVENAIKFGLYDTIGETAISISAAATGNMLLITVKNPFDPETSSPRQGTGFGLNSVQRRLYLLFARNDLLATDTTGNIFTTTLKIPQVQTVNKISN